MDQETGDITIHRHITVSDVGKALNPLQVRMQDEGAAIMGLGHTLMEHYICDDRGRIRNLGAIDYRIPTSMDLPLELHSETVENADGPAYGSKGMSEGALLCVAPAVAAAVREAAGIADPRPAPHPRARLAGAPEAKDPPPVTFVFAYDSRPRPRPPPALSARSPAARPRTSRPWRSRWVSRFLRRSPCPHRCLPRVPGERSGPTDSTASFVSRCAPRAQVGRRFGNPSDPLLVSVRSGRARSMPGDDGHDPEPRPERRRPRRASPRLRRRRPSRPTATPRFRASYPVDRGRRAPPRRPLGPAARRGRGRVPLLEHRPGDRPYRDARASLADPRDGRHGPGDGLREPRRETPARGSCSPAIRPPASTPSTATSCSRPGRGRGRGHPCHRADLVPGRPSAGRRRGAAGRTRTALERHYRDCCDIEFTIEQGRCSCSRSAWASGRPRPRSGWRSTWRRTRRSRCRREEAIARVRGHPRRPAPLRRVPRCSQRGPDHRPRRLAGRSPAATSRSPLLHVRRGRRGPRRHPAPRRDLPRRRPRHEPPRGILTSTGGFASACGGGRARVGDSGGRGGCGGGPR